MEAKMRFRSDAEVWSVVEKFESCTFELAEFDHGRHLAVGMAYLSAESFEEAMRRMRASLQQFSAHHGKTGYHETITRFWLEQLREVRASEQGEELWALCNRAAERLADKELIFAYYSRELLTSADARENWVAPRR